MNFDRERYKQFARQQISGRRRTAGLAILILLVISLIFSIPESRMSYSIDDILALSGSSFIDIINYFNANSQVTPLTTAFSIIETLVSFITTIAIAHFFLAYSRSPEPVPLKTFFEGFNKWGRGILTGLWQTLWLVLWIFLAGCIAVLASIPFMIILPESELLTGIVTLLLLIACFVLIIIKSIEYSHHFYLIAEFPELGIRKALRISILITKGHRADIFITHLTFIGYYLLGMITLGIGLIWIKPYTDMTFINIYHALLKDALETGKIHPEDLN